MTQGFFSLLWKEFHFDNSHFLEIFRLHCIFLSGQSQLMHVCKLEGKAMVTKLREAVCDEVIRAQSLYCFMVNDLLDYKLKKVKINLVIKMTWKQTQHF